MKKITSIMLAVLMVLTACITVLPVSAADGDPFQVGSTTYADFASAYNALPAEGGTITMIGDYTTSADSVNISKNVVIEGADHTFTVTSTGYHFLVNVGYTLTMKNMEWTCGRGMRGFGTVILEDMDITVTAGLLNNLGGNTSTASDASMTLTRCTVKQTGGTDPVIAVYGTNNDTNHRTLTITDSSVTRKTAPTNSSGAAINSSVIGVGSKGTTINVNNSTICYDSPMGATQQAFLFGSNSGLNVALNLNAGSILELGGSDPSLIYPAFVNADANFVINDKGCTYKIGAKAAEVGVQFPKIDKINDVDNTYTNFISGNNTFAENTIYMDRDATEAISFTAQAGTAPDATKKFQIGNNFYDTLANAYEAAIDGDTIVQLAPYYGSTEQITVAKKITYDGNGNSLYLTTGYCFILTSNEFTLKNVNAWNLRVAVRPQTTATQADPQILTVDNCYLVGHSGLMINGSQGTFNNTNDTYNKILVKDSYLVQCGNAEEIVLLRQKVNSTLAIENSDLVYYSKNKNYLIQLENYDSSNGIKTVNVDATSTLVFAGTKASAPNVIYGQNNATNDGAGNYAYLNLAAGATMEIRNAGAANGSFTNTVTNVADAGANYVISAAVAKKGVTLPAHTKLANGDTVLGYTINGTKLTFDTSYTDATAAAPVTFKAVGINLSDFDIVDAASIRLGAPYGIRFGTEISKTLKDTLETYGTVEYGMVAARKELMTESQSLNDAQTVEALDALCAKATMNTFYKENVDGVYQYNMAISIATDPELNKNDGKTYQKVLQAAGYFTLTVDGVSKTFYTENVVESSIYEVAQAYYNDTVNGSQTNATINGIISACQAQS